MKLLFTLAATIAITSFTNDVEAGRRHRRSCRTQCCPFYYSSSSNCCCNYYPVDYNYDCCCQPAICTSWNTPAAPVVYSGTECADGCNIAAQPVIHSAATPEPTTVPIGSATSVEESPNAPQPDGTVDAVGAAGEGSIEDVPAKPSVQ